MTLEDFKYKILKKDKKRNHKVKNSLGIYNGYRYFRKNGYGKNKYKLTESQYFSITRKINNLLANCLSNGDDVKLPCRMGRLEIRKTECEIKLDNKGNIKTNLPIDWDKTLELWYEDEESYRDKTIIRVEEKEIFKVYYNRGEANYTNKTFFEFNINRSIKSKLKSNIKNRKIEAACLSKNKKYG